MSVNQENHVLTLARKAQLICETAPVSRFLESTDLTPYLERFYQLVRNKALEDVLNCYSPDDTASDYLEKIEDMKDPE